MKIKNLKTIWGVILMFLLASPANAKLSESQMCSKIMNFYKEYIRLSVSKDSGSEKKCMELISKNCTSSFASTIKEDSEEGMGLDYICCEYVDDIDLSRSLDVIKDNNYYIVLFYANCLQKDGLKHKLRIQLRISIDNDLISNVEDPFPTQRYENTQTTISTTDLTGTKWQTKAGYATRSSIEYYEYEDGQIIWHMEDGDANVYKYYLSETIPTKFDFSKVGTSTKGNYLVQYDPVLKVFSCFSIRSFSKPDQMMVLKYVTENENTELKATVYKQVSSSTLRSRGAIKASKGETAKNNKNGRTPVEAIR